MKTWIEALNGGREEISQIIESTTSLPVNSEGLEEPSSHGIEYLVWQTDEVEESPYSLLVRLFPTEDPMYTFISERVNPCDTELMTQVVKNVEAPFWFPFGDEEQKSSFKELLFKFETQAMQVNLDYYAS